MNRTCGFILVDLPPTIGLCTLLSLHAPGLLCDDRDTVAENELSAKLNPTMMQKAFGVPLFSFSNKQSMVDLITSGTYNYPYMVQSFPSLVVRLKAPVEIVSGNDCGAINCTVPRVADFFIDGSRDTAVYIATHLTLKHVYTPYIAPHVDRIVGPAVRYLSAPFREWYNNALYAADHLSARGFEAGLPASPENIGLSTISHELAEGLPAYEFSGPSVSARVQTGSMSSLASASSGDSVAIFKSPLVSGSSTSLSSGSISGVIASSRDAPIVGAVKAGNRGFKYPSIPTLPAIGQSSRTLSVLSQSTVDALVQVPTRVAIAGEPVVINVVRSNSRNVLANLAKMLRRVPKLRRRRQANVISRQIATGMRATGKLISAIPSWVSHSALISVPWIFAVTTHLATLDVDISIIHPIQRLASYERFFIAMSTLLFCQCFHDEAIRTRVNGRHSLNDTIRVGGKTRTPADIIFDIDLALPGDTLRDCSPFFKNQFVGLTSDTLLEMLSVHFDTSHIVGSILFYNGPAKYIISDYTAYFNDIFPRFSPYAHHSSGTEGGMEAVAAYDRDLARVRRGAGTARGGERTKRASYSVYGRDRIDATSGGPPRIMFSSASPFTMSVQYLLDTPRLRYEFDIMQASHYNTSFSYYKSLRHFTSTASLNFNDANSHSAFHIVGNITLLEILRGMNPFDLYAPRLNIIRELISGYNINTDVARLRRTSVQMNINLEYCDIPTLLGLFYLLEYPTDVEGFRKIATKQVETGTMKSIGSSLYQARYARVPLLIVLQNSEALAKLKSMFVVSVRVLEDIKSWSLYSPIMLTTSLAMIPSGAYSICISRTRLHTTRYSLFGATNSDLGWDSLFADACDLATLHVTYDVELSEILENSNMPGRIKSVLSIEPDTTYRMPSGGLYDPILSEIINMVEPSHGSELLERTRETNDEGRLMLQAPRNGREGTSGTAEDRGALGSPGSGGRATAVNKDGPITFLLKSEQLTADEGEATTRPDTPVTFWRRNGVELVVLCPGHPVGCGTVDLLEGRLGRRGIAPNPTNRAS